MNPVEEFLNAFPTEQTKKTYRHHLKNYFIIIKAEPENYFKTKRNYEQDVINYWKDLQKYAPLTRISRMSCLRNFLEENDIIIPQKTWKKLRKRTKGKRAVTIDVAPTNKELKQILQHSDILSRAIFILASSSGMRIGEIINLLPEDIDLEYEPMKIYIRGEITKTGEPRIAFASDEAKEAMYQWFNVRDEYLDQAVRRSKGLGGKNPNDERIFPLCYTTAEKKWIRLLRKSGLNERDRTTKHHRRHIHTLRKFFETRMSYAGVPSAIYQQLEGHTGYLNGVYKRYGERELAEAYLKGMNALSVYEVTPDLIDINEELKDVTDENKRLQSKLEMMETRMQQMETLKELMEMKVEQEKIKNHINSH
jgi:integrase